MTSYESIIDNIENGNLTDAMEALFTNDGPTLAHLVIDVMTELTIVRVSSITETQRQLHRLINAWEATQ